MATPGFTYDAYGRAMDEHGRMPMTGERSDPNKPVKWVQTPEGLVPDSGSVPYSGPSFDESMPGGKGYDVENGMMVPGTSGFDIEVGRYRDMGAKAYGRAAPSVYTAEGRQSRQMQMGSLALLDAAARGQGPSIAGTEAVRAGQSLAGSVRGGPGARIAAMRNATQQAGSQYAMGRAREMTDARGQLFGATTGVRGQDIDLGKAAADSIARQRALNAQERQAYERMGQESRKMEQDRYAIRSGNYTRDRANKLQDESEPITFSDERAKTNIVPLYGGSLAALMRR